MCEELALGHCMTAERPGITLATCRLLVQCPPIATHAKGTANQSTVCHHNSELAAGDGTRACCWSDCLDTPVHTCTTYLLVEHARVAGLCCCATLGVVGGR